MTGLNAVNQFHWLALCREQVEPPARNHDVLTQAEDAIRDGIAMMMVIKQPRIDIAFAECCLDVVQVHGHIYCNERERSGRVLVNFSGCP